jgi:uncharacterized protein (DUF2141 family)
MQHIKGYKHLLVLLCVLAGFKGWGQCQLIVPVSGFPLPKGKLMYSLYQSANGFPDDPNKAIRKGAITVSDPTIQFTIDALPPGEYALSLAHDQNLNGKLDINAIGVPQEAIGFSNNVMGAFGPPKFNRAKFTLQHSKQEITEIRLRKVL